MSIIVSVHNNVAAIAVIQAGRLAEYAVWNPGQPDGVGDIYTGRVTARMPALAGSFVDLGDATGFLPDSAVPQSPPGAHLSEGTYLAVRVTRAAQAGKGPRLAASTEAAGTKPGLLRRGPGPLLELSARFPAAPITIDDHALIATLRPHLGARLAYQSAGFGPNLADEIAALQAPIAALPGGALMHITPTRALTAIDIDSAAASHQSPLALNTALIPAIARQILLRNLSGALLIDFAGMKSAARKKLGPALATALAADPLKPKFHGFSALGLAEISRPRIRPALHE